MFRRDFLKGTVGAVAGLFVAKKVQAQAKLTDGFVSYIKFDKECPIMIWEKETLPEGEAEIMEGPFEVFEYARPENAEEIKKQIESYSRGLKRYMACEGGHWKKLEVVRGR